MRICCPIPGIVPGFAMTGAAAYDRNILTQLALSGVDLDVVVPQGRSPLDDDAEGLTIRTVRVPCRPVLAYSVARIRHFPQAIYSVYKQCPFDLLRVHSFFSSSLEMLWTKIRYQLPVPVVVHYHHLDSHPLRKRVVRAAINHSQTVVAFSYAARSDMITHLNIHPSKIHVVYHGIEGRFLPAPRKTQLLRQLGCSPDEQLLLFLGTLEARKNPLFLLNVLTELLARGNRVKLLLCGTGPLVKTIQCEIRRRRLEDTVVLTGVIPEEQKPDYYNLADVFLFPSALEGFGMVLGEAMSCGKPVVAFNTSSVGELVEDGVSGFLVKPGDQAEFVRRTLALLTNEQLRVRMGNRAKERVDRLFRWERATSETRGIYEETIGRFRSGASAPGPVS